MTAAPLRVVAIGGHALSSPAAVATLAGERRAAMAAGRELAQLAAGGHRLLVVHGNGPQVGRLLDADADLSDLDIRVAQTQGELGYLLASALAAATAATVTALVTRVRVAATGGRDPEKAIGPVLAQVPPGVAVRREPGRGWRRIVPSPLPVAILEQDIIQTLLGRGHVIAAGGGGIPVDAAGAAVAGVIDKDRVAALLAVELGASELIIGTDVDAAYRDFGLASARPISSLTVREAEALLDAGAFAPGSMAPKVESSAAFATATGRPAYIGAMGDLMAVLAGEAGTRISVA